jgi:hypothetical protein
MISTIDDYGNVEIRFNTQCEILEAPARRVVTGGAISEVRQKWQPCEECRELVAIDLNVVSVLCTICSDLVDIIETTKSEQEYEDAKRTLDGRR